MINNKRGQGLSTNTIILLILGVVILVVLILGFTMGWDKIFPWLSQQNVDDVVNGCQIACSTGGKYAFCSQPRVLIDAQDNEYRDVTCDYLSTETDYGIETCDIGCDTIVYTDKATLDEACDGQNSGTKVGYVETEGKVKTLKVDVCS